MDGAKDWNRAARVRDETLFEPRCVSANPSPVDLTRELHRKYSFSARMKFLTRVYSKGRIDRAGKELITLPADDPLWEETLAVINNWRSCHSYPLQVIKMTLKNRAKQIDSHALIAQRIKRLPSIAIKLKDNPPMKLSQMQDIGGCRAVMRNVSAVDKLIDVYEKSNIKNPRDRPVWADRNDYIKEPKQDGYRSFHLIFKYQSKSADKAAFNGQRIEIQLRSRLQHAWATAVEIAQTFTGQALKSKVKSANEAWLRFFALMGSAIALREKRPTVPGTPQDRNELVQELRALSGQEKIVGCLDGWGAGIKHLESASIDAHAFLLVLDPTKMELRVKSFKKDELLKAQEQYLIAEKDTRNDPRVQVVLVSVDSIDALRKAYPNYYVDTGVFIDAVAREYETSRASSG